MNTDLPFFLTVDGIEREIDSDFRTAILICNAFNDTGLTQNEKTTVMLDLLYVDDWTEFKDRDEAVKQAIWFIDWGKEYKEKEENSPRLMDWEQDYNLICSAVNNKANTLDVRYLEYMHWWTFLGYFSDRGECQFSTVTNIRDKMNKGQKLDRSEKEILRENRDMILLKNKSNADFENEMWGE